ncbi:MAG: hypothetical protein RJA42_305 [Bacteroidota bacterium]|jgi:hypothetical protein
MKKEYFEYQYSVEYWDHKRDMNISKHTDSLARAIKMFFTRIKRHPNYRIDIIEYERVLATYQDGTIEYSGVLQQPNWQKYLSNFPMLSY